LPAQQLVDAGYVTAKRILHGAGQHQIELVSPVHIDPSWQAENENGLRRLGFHRPFGSQASYLSDWITKFE